MGVALRHRDRRGAGDMTLSALLEAIALALIGYLALIGALAL